MIRNIVFTAIVASLCLVSLAQVKDMPSGVFDTFARPACYRQCKFRFCSDLPWITVRQQSGRDKSVPSQLDAICGITILPNFVGEVAQTGEAIYVGKVTTYGDALLNGTKPEMTPISQWRPAGLDQPFAWSFF